MIDAWSLAGSFFSGSFIHGSDFTSPVTEHQVYHRERVESSQATELVELATSVASAVFPLNDVLRPTPQTAPKEELAAGPNVFGKVVVTKAESGLLQLSLGTKDGIEPQQLLDVLRDGKRIAQVRIVLMRGNQSVGLVESRADAAKIQKGDDVQAR